MTGDGWDALKRTSSDELIALSSVGGITDPDLDDACTDIRARAFVSTFKPVSHEGTVLAPPRPPEPEDPAGFSDLHADDALLDAIGAGDKSGKFQDDKLTELLMSWRQDVEAEPIGDLVIPKLAVATVRRARLRRRSGRKVMLMAVAAAILAILFSGLGVAARDAQPGDMLWDLSRVLYTGHARSAEAAKAVRADLEEAERELAGSRFEHARDLVNRVQAALPAVSDEDGRAQLETQYTLLAAKLGISAPVPKPEGGR